jgi:hypothetical protein
LSSRIGWLLPSRIGWLLSSRIGWLLPSRIGWLLSSRIGWLLPSLDSFHKLSNPLLHIHLEESELRLLRGGQHRIDLRQQPPFGVARLVVRLIDIGNLPGEFAFRRAIGQHLPERIQGFVAAVHNGPPLIQPLHQERTKPRSLFVVDADLALKLTHIKRQQ